ncbi:DUF4350 domain-containing protein [Homoserinimonas sp. A520]
MTVVTPTVQSSLKRTAFWSIAAVLAVLVAAVILTVRGATVPDGVFLSATNPAPGGAMAVVEVLRDQGVSVEVVATQREASDALAGADATLLLHDAGGYLEPEHLHDLSTRAGHTVLVEPAFQQLREVTPEIGAAGAVEGTLAADCDVPAVERAGSVLGDGSGYRVIGSVDTPEFEHAESCLGSGDDVYSLLQFEGDGRTVTVLGASTALSNEHVAELGNAALALGLLGENPTLVWYQPTLADVAGSTATIADLTPAWLSAVLALLFLVVIAAGVWKGRRMGPLVVEHLPVTVPSNETMDGRARLYQKASARLRALDALRVGTVSRLATTCGLPRTASVAEVAAVTASVTGRNLHEVRWLLLEAEPATDRDLIQLSDDLMMLEKTATHHATGGTARQPTNPGE